MANVFSPHLIFIIFEAYLRGIVLRSVSSVILLEKMQNFVMELWMQTDEANIHTWTQIYVIGVHDKSFSC